MGCQARVRLFVLDPHEGEVLGSKAPAPDHSLPPVVHLDPAPPAADDQHPFVTTEELAALGAGASDPSHNLARQRLRDALIALGDELNPTLTRGSRARLHPYPEEAHRTSAWRVDPGTGTRIEQLVMAFGDGLASAVGYSDRARVELLLSAEHFTVRVAVPPGVAVDTATDEVQAARAVGAGDACDEPGSGWAFGMSHPLTPRAPTQHGLAARVADELEVLLPIWLQIAGSATEEGTR